jgi:hypothetical protein
MRVLGSDVLEAKSREQTNDTLRDQLGRLCKGVMFGDISIGHHVKSTADPHHHSLPAETAQVLRMDAARGQIADPQDAKFSGEI